MTSRASIPRGAAPCRFLRRKSALRGAAVVLFALAGCHHVARQQASGPADSSLFRLDEGAGKPTRLVTDAVINGLPVRLLLDTGADAPLFLLPQAAKRLGVEIEPASQPESEPEELNPGTMITHLTKTFRFEGLGLPVGNVQGWIMEIPEWLPLTNEPEGIVGWPAVRSNILYFSLEDGFVAAPLEEIPPQLPQPG